MGLHEQLKVFTGSYVADRHPDLWAALAAAEGADSPADERVTAELLAPVVAAAADRRVRVACPAYYTLFVLTDYFTAARQAVATLARDSRSHARTWAVLSVGRHTPRQFQLEVIGGGLADRSDQVRRHAANQALTYRLRELLPAMESAAAGARSAGVRREIEHCRLLLRDGYTVTPAGDDGVNVSVAYEGGGIGGPYVTRAELEARGIEAIVSEALARRRRERQAEQGAGGIRGV